MVHADDSDENDLRRWAAYTLGRNPTVVRIWQVDLWFEEEVLVEAALQRLNGDIAALDKAIGLLTEFGRIDARALHRFHLDLRDYIAACRDMLNPMASVGYSSGTSTSLSGADAWRGLALESSSLLTQADDDLHAWFRLGRMIADFLILHGEGDDDFDGLDRMTADIIDLLDELSSGIALTSTRDGIGRARAGLSARKPGKGMVGSSKFTRSRWIDILQLDARIAQALRSEVPVEPILVLDRDQPTLFGMPIPIRINQKHISCLWVLAENVGRAVERQKIVDEIRTEYEREGLTMVVSRVRTMLRKLIKKYRAATGSAPLPHEALAYIVGDRGTSGDPGAYTLMLDPLLVHIATERPRWM